VTPEPANDTARPGGPRRRSLDQDDIAEAAQRIIENDGIEALTMRRLSSELGVGAMTLYGYVRSKTDIVNLVASRHFAELVVPSATDGDWVAAITATYASVRRLYLHHPYIVVVHTNPAAPPPLAYGVIESILGLFEGLGLDRPTAATVHIALLNYTLGAALFGLPRSPEHAVSPAFVSTLQQLSATDFPNLSATAMVLAQAASDEQFEFGLELMIRGMLPLLPGS